MSVKSRIPLRADERRWLLAEAGSGVLLPVRLILTPAFGYEIFRCFAPEAFLPVWAAAMAVACLVILLTEQLAGRLTFSPAVCRRRFILCAAAGCAISLAVVTFLSAVPFYEAPAASRRAAVFFLLAACALEVFCHFADRQSHLLAPDGTERLQRLQNAVRSAGCLFAVALGLLLWLPGADLAARYALLFTLTALIRILSAAPLACLASDCTPSPPFALQPNNRCAWVVSLLCVVTGAGIGVAGTLAFGFGAALASDSFEVVRLLGVGLLLSLLGRVPGRWLRRHGSLARCAVLCGALCAVFAAAVLWPGRITYFIMLALLGLFSAPLYRLERGLMDRVTGRFPAQAFALTRRLFLAGQLVGLLAAAALCAAAGVRAGLVWCEAACGTGCVLAALLACRSKAAHTVTAAGSAASDGQ